VGVDVHAAGSDEADEGEVGLVGEFGGGAGRGAPRGHQRQAHWYGFRDQFAAQAPGGQRDLVNEFDALAITGADDLVECVVAADVLGEGDDLVARGDGGRVDAPRGLEESGAADEGSGRGAQGAGLDGKAGVYAPLATERVEAAVGGECGAAAGAEGHLVEEGGERLLVGRILHPHDPCFQVAGNGGRWCAQRQEARGDQQAEGEVFEFLGQALEAQEAAFAEEERDGSLDGDGVVGVGCLSVADSDDAPGGGQALAFAFRFLGLGAFSRVGARVLVRRTAHTLNSGILAIGSRASMVRTLAGASRKWKGM